MHGKSRAKKMILGHTVCKERNNRIHQEKGLINCEARGYIEHDARETQERVHSRSVPGMRRRSDVSFRSFVGGDVVDHGEMSSRRLNWYVNETDLFETL